MLGSRQTDRPDVIRELNRTVQLHQGDVIVKIVRVVVWMRGDPLQVLLHDGTPSVSLHVKTEVNFPCPRL